MNSWRLLLRYGGWRLFVSAGFGLAAGAALAALMRLVHRVLTLPAAETAGAAPAFLGFLALYFAGTLAAEYLLTDAAERLQWELRRKMLRQIVAAPLRQLEAAGFARLHGLLSRDVHDVAEFLRQIPDVTINFAIAGGCLAYMAWLSPAVFAFNLGFIVLAAGCYLLPQRAVRRLGLQAGAAWDRQMAQVAYALHGLKSLQLSRARRRGFFRDHFSPAGDGLRRLNRRTRLLHVLTERTAEILVLGNVGCLLFALPRLIDLSPATATGLLLAAMFARQPLKDSLALVGRTQRLQVAVRRLRDADLDPFAPELPPESPEPPASFRELALERVTFRYEGDHGQPGFAAGPFNLRLRAGEIVFVVGGNGAGKTTFAKLLCGLYPPAEGTVAIDGSTVADADGRTRLAARFAAVFPDDPLFDCLLGAEPDALRTSAPRWLATLGLEKKLSLAGTAFSTVDLSQGQRRRLLLLGAILENRPILLLDEWAADQDPAFRHCFYRELLPQLRADGKTVVVITHDDRYFDAADRVIKLDGGEIVPAA